MHWYLLIKYLHILAVAITVGGMFARQLVRGVARNSGDINTVASLTGVVLRIDRAMVIPWSSIMYLMGIILAVIARGPIFGFLQGAAQNWLLVSIVLIILMNVLIPAVFLPHNRKVESLLQAALTEGRVTPELSAALADRKNALAHHAEEATVLIVAALMVFKPF